jgi:hypothetical protein
VALAEVQAISFTAFGVRLAVSVPARLDEPARALLPPNASVGDGGDATASVAVDERDGQLIVTAQGQHIAMTEDPEIALGMLDAQIRAQVALLAPNHIFVHAGVVAAGGRAIVLPGFTFAGKTTLTRALVEAGAVYYSDEFAVIDATGMVHPYPKPLSIRHRDGSGRSTETSPESLGARTGRAPVPVGLVAITTYRRGATVNPQPLAPGAALLAMLGHTIPARTRPQQSIASLKAALRGATVWKSDRGEAPDAARAILDAML